MELFAKTRGLGLVNLLRESGLYPFFRKIDGSQGNHVSHRNLDLVMMGSNNYLGLTHDPRVMEASIQAIRDWGTGCTGSRFLNGNLALHEELERELAAFYGTEACLVFASGFMANQGAISALAGEGDHIFSDGENHACIIEGCKLTKAKIHVYRHMDMEHLRRAFGLSTCRCRKTDHHRRRLLDDGQSRSLQTDPCTCAKVQCAHLS